MAMINTLSQLSGTAFLNTAFSRSLVTESPRLSQYLRQIWVCLDFWNVENARRLKAKVLELLESSRMSAKRRPRITKKVCLWPSQFSNQPCPSLVPPESEEYSRFDMKLHLIKFIPSCQMQNLKDL